MGGQCTGRRHGIVRFQPGRLMVEACEDRQEGGIFLHDQGNKRPDLFRFFEPRRHSSDPA